MYKANLDEKNYASQQTFLFKIFQHKTNFDECKQCKQWNVNNGMDLDHFMSN